MKMKELPASERPYEKLETQGAGMLSNAELIAIIIKSGTKEESSVNIAQKILSLGKSENDSLRFLQDISIEELKNIKGIGKVKAIQLKAICEFAKRISRPLDITQVQIKTPKDVADLLINEIKYEKKEIVKTIILNSKNVIVKIVDVCFGGTNSAILKPKDVLQEAIKLGAPKIILVHNHPSGDPTPSNNDIEFTKRMIKASQIIGVELLDHIVIGDCDYKSIFYILGNYNP